MTSLGLPVIFGDRRVKRLATATGIGESETRIREEEA